MLTFVGARALALVGARVLTLVRASLLTLVVRTANVSVRGAMRVGASVLTAWFAQ
jgi:hypothetical protein